MRAKTRALGLTAGGWSVGKAFRGWIAVTYRRMTGTGDGATTTLAGHGTSARTLTGSGSSTPRL